MYQLNFLIIKWMRLTAWTISMVFGALLSSVSSGAASGEVQVVWGESMWTVSQYIQKGGVVTLSFPDAMVNEAEIGKEDPALQPILWQPELPGKWVWKSPTEGRFTIGERVVPGTRYRILPKSGLKTLRGVVVDKQKVFDFKESAPFEASFFFEEKALPKRPVVEIRFNYPVNNDQIVNVIYFQNRDTRERHPIEVELGRGDPDEGRLGVVPRSDLPRGATFDLVVENVTETLTGAVMPGPKVFSVGNTEPLTVRNVWAENPALDPAQIHIEFNEPVAASEGGRVRLEPPVQGLRFSSSENRLTLSGSFDATTRYKVRIPADIVGNRGYSMAKDSLWGATFSRKTPAILFPDLGDPYSRRFSDHSVSRRGGLGIQFPFAQVNTGELHWRLAVIPAEKLPAVMRRALEFHENAVDPVTKESVLHADTGLPLKKKTDLLVDLAHLQVIGEGVFPGSFEDKAISREILWTPGGMIPSGPCLLEITGKNSRGEVIGNRALINFTELSVLQTNEPNDHVLRIVRLEDGTPLADAPVRLVSEDNERIAEIRTDARGLGRFAKTLFLRDENRPAAAYFLIDVPGGVVCEPVRRYGVFGGYFWAREAEPEPERVRVKLVPDRNLYRPAQTMRFKGFARLAQEQGSRLKVVPGQFVYWSVESIREPQVEVHSGETTTDDFGGFEGSWEIPENLPVGPYQLRVKVPSLGDGNFSETIRVEEFRPPPFLVDLSEAVRPGDVGALSVQSRLFHGAPNAGAEVRWTSTWRELGRRANEEFAGDAELQVSGTGRLSENGTYEIEVNNPMKDRQTLGWYRVLWEVDVIGADGQTIRENVVTRVHPVPHLLSVEPERRAGKRIFTQVEAWKPGGERASGIPVELEVCREVQKSVREKISNHVFRIHKTTVEEKLPAVRGFTPFAHDLHVDDPGMYRVSARVVDNPSIPKVSETVSVGGNEGDPPAEYWQTTQRTFEVESDRSVYQIGDTAVLSAKAPFAGKVWISLECGDVVLSRFEADLAHNAGEIRIPITRECYPNVWASIYLLRPGGKAQLPAERIARIELRVRNPLLELGVEPQLAVKSVEPGQEVEGNFLVTAAGKPVLGADVTLYAVDDALLQAGDWKAPDLLEAMYLKRAPLVQIALPDLWRLGIDLGSHVMGQKGFIVGGGGDDSLNGRTKKTVRKDFLPVATWQAGIRTDERGRFKFRFRAPDSLTRYRILALAQTREGAFGVGMDVVEVSKSIQIEPALPRFVRQGDQVELRAIVRQKVADAVDVTVHCSGSVALIGGSGQTQRVERGKPSVYRFLGAVGELAAGTVRFTTEAVTGDSVEVQFPIHPPTLLRRESVFTAIGEGGWKEAVKSVPEHWNQAKGEAEVSISASPWFPKITALPRVLEYPHGCAEQIASRILGYTVLGDLLEFLPDDGGREQAYRGRVSKGLESFGAAMLSDGSLPYWPGRAASPFATIIGCWAVQSAKSLGWDVSENLNTHLFERVFSMSVGKDDHASDFARCFASLVVSLSGQRTDVLEPVLRDLYARRAKFSDEMRAFLAVAMHARGVLEVQREQLLGEIDSPTQSFAFDPHTFSSTSRVEAIRAWAFARIHPEDSSGKAREKMRAKISELMEGSSSLSTQENFWLLMAFRELHRSEIKTQIPVKRFQSAPNKISRNGYSFSWGRIPVQSAREFTPVKERDAAKGLSVLWNAQFRMAKPEDDNRLDRGLRVERLIVNRTDPSRTGSKESPFRLGDELVITFRLVTNREHHYVALETELPACFESVNAGIPSVARSSRNSTLKNETQLDLAYSQLRDSTVNLYFDRVDPGVGTAYTVVRVTSVGTFTWPPSQATPMYDSRFSGQSPGGACHVVE